jgi:putative membrane protein insertion efficiency factor
MIDRVWAPFAWVLAHLLIAAVRCYQAFVRPVLPPLCRFTPSCSEYMILAVEKHGPLRGGCKGVWRVCRCNPWNRGGWDPP